MNLIDHLQQTLGQHITATYNLTPSKPWTFDLNTDEQKMDFGDISTNAAMVLAQGLKKNPREVAQELCSTFKHSSIQKLEIAGPGFINIFLTPEAFKENARELFTQKNDFFKDSLIAPKNYNIEFVSANPTGPLHLGHGRGGIIGDVLGNILSFLGHKVTKEFYINDAGSQIQKLGASFKARCYQALGHQMAVPEEGYQGTYLISLAEQCIQKHGAAVLTHDDTFFELHAKEHLLHAIKKTLQDYGIHFDVWFSEKTLHESQAIEKAIALLDARGYVFTHDNAVWFKSTEFGDDKDRVLQKGNGDLTYVAADIAYMENKLERGFDKLIYILGQDHHSYVQRLKGLMTALGHDAGNLDVILYQLVTLKEGSEVLRMSKRAGTMVTLHEVIDIVGKDVARFFYLHRKADAHLDFDLDLALKKTEENPVYYLQYAYVRMRSIEQKAQAVLELTALNEQDIDSLNRDEQLLIKKMMMFKYILKNSAQTYQTHLVTYYLIELAQCFHRYYAHHRVIDQNAIPQSRSRLALIVLIRQTLHTGLTLLGIDCPESM